MGAKWMCVARLLRELNVVLLTFGRGRAICPRGTYRSDAVMPGAFAAAEIFARMYSAGALQGRTREARLL
jgi:hypothetical protein